MNPRPQEDDARAARRRKLKFRSWHRGMREMDLIIGRFADAFMDDMADADLDAYEALIELPDPELLAWVTGMASPPAAHDSVMFRRLRAFYFDRQE